MPTACGSSLFERALSKPGTASMLAFNLTILHYATIRHSLARSNDSLRKHPSFLKAARGAIEIYLQLADKPYEKPTTNGKHGE